MNRIHVVGAGPRTGTTLMAELLVACFEVDGFDGHETKLTRHRRDVQLYVTKWPGDSARVGPRLRLDPHFHVICMVRDPRDVIVSVHAREPGRYWTSLDGWNRQIRHVRRLTRHPRFVVVRYEDLVNAPDALQESIMNRMPFLRKTQPFSAFHAHASPSAASLRAMGGLRPIGGERIGNWKNHLPRVAGQIARHGSAFLRDLSEFGYEADDAWLAALNGIEPDTRPDFKKTRHRSLLNGWWGAALHALYVVGARRLGVRIV